MVSVLFVSCEKEDMVKIDNISAKYQTSNKTTVNTVTKKKKRLLKKIKPNLWNRYQKNRWSGAGIGIPLLSYKKSLYFNDPTY